MDDQGDRAPRSCREGVSGPKEDQNSTRCLH